MGYRYGTRRYGEGLFSSWPNAWQVNTCEAGQNWTPIVCEAVTSETTTAAAAAKSRFRPKRKENIWRLTR